MTIALSGGVVFAQRGALALALATREHRIHLPRTDDTVRGIVAQLHEICGKKR